MADSLVKRVVKSVKAGIVGAVGGAASGALAGHYLHQEYTGYYSAGLAILGGTSFFLGEMFYSNRKSKDGTNS